MKNLFKEHRLIKFERNDYYLTRESDVDFSPNAFLDNPIAYGLAAGAEVLHRGSKLTSDVLRLAQGENKQDLNRLPEANIGRIRESTSGAAQNVFGGVKDTFKERKIVRGPLRVIQGAVDAFDILPSTISDGVINVSGMRKDTRKAASKALAL